MDYVVETKLPPRLHYPFTLRVLRGYPVKLDEQCVAKSAEKNGEHRENPAFFAYSAVIKWG